MAHAPLRVDVLVGDRIVLATGGIIRLTDLPPVQMVWRTLDGWLVRTSTDDGRTAIWFVTPTQPPRALVASAHIAVGKAGTGPVQVAWGEAGSVSVANVVDGHLSGTATTSGTGKLVPTAIADGGVLLGPETGGQPTYDMWFPSDGRFRPGPVGTQVIVGASGDSSRLLGFVGQRFTCLALIQPVGLATLHSRCDLDLTPTAILSPSPDGRWLVTLSQNGVDLYELDHVWGSPAPAANWPILASSATWLPDGSFVVVDGPRVIHLQVNDPDWQEVTEMVMAGGDRVRAITDLRL
jgi:hypothetical protein